MLNESNLIQQISVAEKILQRRDHFDIKSIVSNKSLLQFNEQLLSYHPGWIKFLYKIREVLLKFLRIPHVKNFEPVYRTVDSAENAYWVGVISDTHLTAHLGVLKQKQSGEASIFYVFSIVHYHSFTGKIYFNIIKPFHHLVVYWMMKSAAKN